MTQEQFDEMMKALRSIKNEITMLLIVHSVTLTEAQSNVAVDVMKKAGLA